MSITARFAACCAVCRLIGIGMGTWTLAGAVGRAQQWLDLIGSRSSRATVHRRSWWRRHMLVLYVWQGENVDLS
jgi:hypothetical protein